MTTTAEPTASQVPDPEQTREAVRERYAEAAVAVATATTPEDAWASSGALAAERCGPDCCGETTQATYGIQLYEPGETAGLPEAAVLASLGCGNPFAVAELREGETVLDLGSGGGIDVLLSARRVGHSGRAIGVDMTDEMLALAERNRAESGLTNVEFVKGTIEELPLADASVDVVISNCVVNLATDKPAVFREMARVLRAGGRIGISDVVADDVLTPAQRAERGSYVGCIAGALSFREYRDGLRAAGLADVEIRPTHAVADGMHSALIKATKPALAERPRAGRPPR